MNEHKKKALISLKKAKTSLETIIEKIEQDEYCGDIMVQNLAAIGLIKSSNSQLLQAFLETCDEDTEKKKQELLTLFTLSQK